MKFLTQAAKVRNEQKKDKRRLAVFLCLAVIVALGTAAALKMYGQAMSHKDKRLICQLEAHQHTEQCYDGDKVICGYADYIVHTHNDDCYDSEGILACHLQEAAAHTHTDECYAEEKVLVCTEQEQQAHQHTESCYAPEKGDLQCQIEEHAHTEGCYDAETGELICQIEEHQHDDNCYAWEEVLTCAYAAESHQHSDECYTKEKGDLQCQIEEHTHAAECYNENNELICEKEEHIHNDECYAWNDVLTCNLEETPAGHTHTDACYEKKKVLTCGQLELHTHDESCQDENGALVCGMLELKEHTHQEECFETIELTDEEVAAKLEAEKLEDSFHEKREEDANEPEDETGSVSEDASVSGDASISGDEAGSVSDGDASISGDSISGDSVSGNSVSENDAHVHDESCYDAAGGLMCGYEDIKEPEIIKTYEDDAYIVTAKYTKKADIPEKAELRAELITAESGGEHYAEREAEIRRALEDDSVSMNALFKIGFYVDEEEVEPKDDIIITVQFLDDKGMKDGSPIAVVHFAEGGSEIINGGKAKDRSTTFKTGSFSEFGIVEGYEVPEKDQNRKKDDNKQGQEEEKMVRVSETCEYSNDMFHALFRIRGEVKMPVSMARTVEYADQKEKASKVQEDENLKPDAPSESEGAKEDIEESGTPMPNATDENKENEADAAEDKEDSGNVIENATETSDTVTENEAETPDVTVNDEEESGEASSDSAADDEEAEGSADVAGGEETSAGHGLEFKVEAVDKDAKKFAEDYAAVIACMDEANEGKDRLMLQVMAYSLTCDGEPLDISDCEVSVEVTPSESLKKTANEVDNENPDNSEAPEEVTLSVIQTMASADAGETEGTGEKVGRIINAASVSALHTPLAATLDTKGTQGIAAFSADSVANPSFTVEFYANIEQLDMTDVPAAKVEEEKKKAGSILVIDTSGKNLPTNGGRMNAKKMRLNSDNRVAKKTVLTEVYSSNKYEYIQAPGLVYFNKLAKNKNYKLSEIQVQRKESDTWETYSCADGKEWHFTNKEKTQIDNPNDFIWITAGAKIRLVHDVVTVTRRNGASFYDYDISDGKMYKTYSTNGGTHERNGAKTHDGGDVWYMYTERQGINDAVENQTFGFGNATTTIRSTMGNNVGNKANALNANYGSPTFGLVKGLDIDIKGEKRNLEYADGVRAPKLFNEGSEKSKSSYTGNLVFDQRGDTFTFTGAEVLEKGEIVSGKDNVDVFTRQRNNWNNTYYFAGNDFYPLDTVSSAGKIDLMFGTPESNKSIQSFSDSKDLASILDIVSPQNKEPYLGIPVSDDGQNHNHYFGMHYTIGFDLVKDYIGPLEYLFYGDDDMWVFLDDGKTAQLVCDIGGVHSSVGEYVDLWDYIDKGSVGHYNLTFFYTERGASGSTCWMQFTLPSVSFATTDQDTGKLEIEKKLTGVENKDQEFGFEIEFTDEKGQNLMNDYSYTKYQKGTDNVLENDILIWNNSRFTLKADEYIVISFLPEGSKYTITEIGPVTDVNKEPGVNIEWTPSGDNPYKPEITGGNPTGVEGKITGTITKNSTVKILYNNVQKFELPETGGAGAGMYLMIGTFCIMTGAVLVYRKRIIAKRA